jgi:GNAT superfamily N-acetyltransferase
MDIEIKKLSPDLMNDYFHFFDHVAFTDNSDWAGCYCVWYHLTDEHDTERMKFAASHKGESFNRVLAKRCIEDGTICGYLAYVDGSVAGWCNVNDKERFARLSKDRSPELWDSDDSPDKVRSIVCFTIAPNMRRKGIATALLEKACVDAENEGYMFVEAYPGTGEVNSHSYHGPFSIYEKLGFTVHKDLEEMTIVRKYF